MEALRSPGRFRALRCGRRWGKTLALSSVGCSDAIQRKIHGFFAPDYKILSETYRECEEILSPLIESSSKIDGIIRLANGGRIDFWTLNNPKAGRSRKYHSVSIDEAAFTDADMMDIWRKNIRPSLLDYIGSAIVASTPNGADTENFFWRICNEPEHGFREFHAPTHTNPFLPADELARLKLDNHPDVYRQEYLAEFVDWSGAAFFPESCLLIDGKPAPLPSRVDQVFAVIDTALKDTLEHDGTAVVYYGRNKIFGTKLLILDWDILQIEGSLLEAWLPTVARKTEDYAAQLQAREGSKGLWIEDKASGIVLLQQARRRGMNAWPIDSKLTALGKEARALSVSGYYFRGDVKITQHAYDKVVSYRGQTRNHFLSQVCGFRMGQKQPHGQDLLDCATYGPAIALGNSDGY